MGIERASSAYDCTIQFICYLTFCSGEERLNTKYNYGIFLAILAAGLYALSLPISKLLLDYMPSTLMAGFLYTGAGLGMVIMTLVRKLTHRTEKEQRLTRQEFPFAVAMVALDIAAPICMLLGLSITTARERCLRKTLSRS